MAGLTSVRIEGGLLGPDVLEQLLAGDLPGQKLSDYGLESRRSLTDEIAAVFADARALWGVFQNRLTRLKPDDLATSVTRDAWLIPLLGLLGYEPRFNAKAHDVDGLSFAISHRDGELAEGLPIHMVGFRQELGRVAASGRPRMSPHALLQEYLNRTEQVWGLVTNGKTLRLLRDCSFIRRQAYVEFDLPAILEEQRFQDFAALYRLIHRSRMPRRAGDSECFIERYHSLSIEQGGRVREHLRDGVEECIRQLANGFLRHPASDDLRNWVAAPSEENSRVSPEQLYRQLLTLVYRFLFLLVSEDRGLLGADPIYLNHYGVARLRRLLDLRGAWTDHDDLWQSLRVLWTVFASDAPQPALDNKPMASALGLPVLNGDLFAWQLLDGCTLSNRDLLAAFEQLATYTDRKARVTRRVNYGALDVEELGSVYESLLDYHPVIKPDHAARPQFDLVAGSERKTTGSYYTRPELVGEIIRLTVEPLIAARLSQITDPKKAEAALLSIKVCDPACGSGHFLLAAARRIGKELSRVRTGEDEPAPERVRESVRDVISHCIYGVDRNELAVDLCRVALWLEGHTTDKPLTFLDHRIRRGDSLAGVSDLKLLDGGVPDDAYKLIEGDDSKVARRVKAQNHADLKDLKKQQGLLGYDPQVALSNWTRASVELDRLADDSPAAIRNKRQLFERSHAEPGWLKQKQACDLWTAAFFQSLQNAEVAVTSAIVADQLAGRPIDPRTQGIGQALASKYHFFHWPLEFPEVFEAGGFDMVFGNPPWETLSPDAKEFFAAYDVQVRFQDRDGQQKIIDGLLAQPEIAKRWADSCRDLYALVRFIKQSGRYRMFAPGNLGKGDFNVYRMFVENALRLTRPGGWAAQVVPEGLYNGANCMAIRKALYETCQLETVLGFENTGEVWFKDIDTRMKFCVYAAKVGGSTDAFRAAFNIRSHERLTRVRSGESLRIPVRLVREFSPDALAIMELGSQQDIDIAAKMYRWPAFGDETAGPPRRVYMREIDMGTDRERFDGTVGDVPLYEGRMVSQYEHRAKGYRSGRGRAAVWEDLPFSDPNKSIQPQWYVAPSQVPDKCLERMGRYRIGFCDVASPTNERTLVAAIIPPGVLCGHKVPTIQFAERGYDWYMATWIAIANSYAMDSIARRKVSLSMTFTILDSLPFPRVAADDARARELVTRAMRLTCTGLEMSPLWNSLASEGWVEPVGVNEIPGELDDERRLQLQAEIDVLVARDLFELTVAEMEHILGTFPTQKRYQEEKYGEFRSRRLILEGFESLPRPR
jgi:hypothetical protein